jgi:type IV secretion system protein VirD4
MRDGSSSAPRRKLRTLLLVLDEFPLFGRQKFFETAMGAMAGYGIKAYLVCQSPNHIIRAYGRDNVIVDNCHMVTAFAATDNESAKRISEMAGEVWEVRPQESEQRPRSLLGPHKGAVTYREERRPLISPGDVRQLPRDEQLIFVAGSKPIRCKKLKFDREPIFAKRMLPASRARVRLTTSHDWENVAPFGRLAKDKKGAVRVETPRAQADLFETPLSISEQALAGLRGAPAPAAAATNPKPQSETKEAPSRRLGV